MAQMDLDLQFQDSSAFEDDTSGKQMISVLVNLTGDQTIDSPTSKLSNIGSNQTNR